MKIEAVTGMQAIKKLVILIEFLFFHTHMPQDVLLKKM